MVNVGQILIKVGTLPDVEGWQCKEDVIIIYRKDFIELMQAPGIPCYSAMKTINEKWRMLSTCYGLVEKVFPAFATGKDGKILYDKQGINIIDESRPPRAYLINKSRARIIINDTIPKRIRNNYAATQRYLKTGEI